MKYGNIAMPIKTATKKSKKKESVAAERKTTVKKTAVKKTVASAKSVIQKAPVKKVVPPRKKRPPAQEEVQKLRIKVAAYEHKLLDASVKQILDTALRHNATVWGPVPLPTEIKKYTVNRAPFIYKNAREQFEMRIRKRLIDIVDPSAPLIEALTNLTLPSGVFIDVKML